MMKTTTEHKHIVDIMFVLSLFCVFAVSAILLIIIGANVYQKTITDMEQNSNCRTVYSYLSEKIRQNDNAQSLQVSTFDGCNALILSSEVNGESYNTYIYVYEGWLKELFTKPDSNLSADAGQNILPAASLITEYDKNNILHITVKESSQNIVSLLVSNKSQ